MQFLVPYVQVVQILLSLALIAVVLLQSRGSGFSATFSADTSIYRTRRGVERLLFQFTIGLAIVFVLISLISVKLSASERAAQRRFPTSGAPAHGGGMAARRAAFPACPPSPAPWPPALVCFSARGAGGGRSRARPRGLRRLDRAGAHAGRPL